MQLVDAYAATRRAAALFNSAAAGTALAHLRPRPMMRVKQRTAAALAPVVPGCGSWLEHAPYGPRHGPPADAEPEVLSPAAPPDQAVGAGWYAPTAIRVETAIRL